jgi:hypothetical protein
MRSKVWEICRGAAPLLFVLAACTVAAGCDSMCGDWDPCGTTCGAPCPQPCPQPCAVESSGQCGPFPPNAVCGEAWCCVFIPPTYATEVDRVCVCPEQCQKEWVPPVYECRSKQVCACPEQRRQIPIPAEYATQQECVEVCPARTEWRRVDCTPEQLAAGEQQGECWALICIPPQYEQRCRQVCVREASCREEVIPPVYETVQEQVEVSCGYYKDHVTPARYEDRPRQVCTGPGRWEWRKNEACVVPQPQVCNPCVPTPMMPMQPGPMPAPGAYDSGPMPPPPPPPPMEPAPAPMPEDTQPR